jgi:hypothetical protein
VSEAIGSTNLARSGDTGVERGAESTSVQAREEQRTAVALVGRGRVGECESPVCGACAELFWLPADSRAITQELHRFVSLSRCAMPTKGATQCSACYYSHLHATAATLSYSHLLYTESERARGRNALALA